MNSNEYRALDFNVDWQYGYYAMIPNLPLPTVVGGGGGQMIDPSKITYSSYITPSDYRFYDGMNSFAQVPYVMKKVNPKTICRYVGKIGLNNVDAYENDFVTGTVVPFDSFNGKIVFDEETKSFAVQFYQKPEAYTSAAVYQGLKRELSYYQNIKLEVIGNKFENPELETDVEYLTKRKQTVTIKAMRNTANKI